METLRALVVDDSEHLRRLVKHVLQRFFDMEVVEAADGAEALKELERAPYDLAVVDLKMPVLDGLEFIKRVRAREETQALPIVVATVEADAQSEQDVMAAGANRYLTKPLQATEVADAVEALLGIKRKPGT